MRLRRIGANRCLQFEGASVEVKIQVGEDVISVEDRVIRMAICQLIQEFFFLCKRTDRDKEWMRSLLSKFRVISFNPFNPKFKKSFSQPFKEKCITGLEIKNEVSSLLATKNKKLGRQFTSFSRNLLRP